MNELCLRTATAPAVDRREREFNGQGTMGSGEEPHGNCKRTPIIIEMALAGDPKPLMRGVNGNRWRNSPAIFEYSEKNSIYLFGTRPSGTARTARAARTTGATHTT